MQPTAWRYTVVSTTMFVVSINNLSIRWLLCENLFFTKECFTLSFDLTLHTGWRLKVSHYHESSLSRIKTRHLWLDFSSISTTNEHKTTLSLY